MTELTKPDGRRPAAQAVGTSLLRALSWVAGLAFILIGTVLPVLFIGNELRKPSPRRNGVAIQSLDQWLAWLPGLVLRRCVDLQPTD